MGYTFALSFVYKHLQRSSHFIECPDTNDEQCSFGWMVFDNAKDEELTCEACGCLHQVTQRQQEEKDGFADMISQGTLWESGELAYQQNLQRNNLPEFIKLLARNGIKY